MKQQFLTQGELLLRLIIACLLGLAIGFERKNRNKMAGVRTHAIVAFGAALMMIVSKYGFGDVGSSDGSRIAAQIVSGIGFLGAGVIFVKDNTSVSGLTTAAGIWTTAGVGMCIGAGQYFIAISSGVILVILQEVLHRVNFLSKEAYRATVRLILKNKESVQDLEKYILNEQVEIESIKINRANKCDTKIEMELVFSPQHDKMEFLNRLAAYPGVSAVRG
ncbi:MAG: MgtC/SapB family protein [Lachnospiraceae bacterium]|nr:MgtC/SapB family protein [Lachnospiraceae bacterium]